MPAFGGGVLYLLSGIIISSTLNGAPTVGLLQGLGPALSGVANPAVSPRAAEVRFISHHALTLIAGSALAAIAIGALTLVLLLLVDATRFRRPESWAAARPLVLCGGTALALASLGHQILNAILTHRFAVGHDFSNHAVDLALTRGTANEIGLLTRWVGVLGIFTGVLIFLPIGGAELEIVPAFWMVAMGLLYAERWPNGDPPAWAAGEARPWPSQAELRAAKQAGQGKVLTAGAADVAPAPTQPVSGGSSRKRRRKRGARS